MLYKNRSKCEMRIAVIIHGMARCSGLPQYGH